MSEAKQPRNTQQLLASIETVKQAHKKLSKSHENDSSRLTAFLVAYSCLERVLTKKQELDTKDPKQFLLNKCDEVLENPAGGSTAGKVAYYLGILPVIAYGTAEVAEHCLSLPSMSQELFQGNPESLLHWVGVYSFLMICHHLVIRMTCSSNPLPDPARLPWVPAIISGEIPTKVLRAQVDKMKSIINDPDMQEVLDSYQTPSL